MCIRDRYILGRRVLDLHLQTRRRIKRRQVVEVDLVTDLFGIVEIDGVDLEKREIAVSYTHLDVYKRQQRYVPATRCLPNRTRLPGPRSPSRPRRWRAFAESVSCLLYTSRCV